MKLPPLWKFGVLAALYFVQGLPFGFQSSALPLYLEELQLSYTDIGLARALAAPWLFKFLWAPWVDRFGPRTRWIFSAQLLLSAACAAAAFFPLSAATLAPFLACVLLMNLFAATQDIAVDGLAVDLLSAKELGAGNTAQVVGYKLGALTGGSLLVALAAFAGWPSTFLAMAALCLLAMAWLVVVSRRRDFMALVAARRGPTERVGWHDVREALRGFLSRSGARWLVLAVLTYKLGETLADAMFGVWLMRGHGLPKHQVALWLGGWGMGASVVGSFAGGFLATRFTLPRAVFIAAVLRLLPLLAQWALTLGVFEVSRGSVVPITLAEHCFGGALTTTMFALMMASVDRRVGATHFTVLASLEVAGKAVPGLLSGVLVDAVGVPSTFGAAVVLSAAFLLVSRRLTVPTSASP